MAISSYSFLSVHRQPQEPLAGAAGAAGAPGWSSRGSSPTLWDGLLFPGEECGRVLSSLCSPVCLVQNVTFLNIYLQSLHK